MGRTNMGAWAIPAAAGQYPGVKTSTLILMVVVGAAVAAVAGMVSRAQNAGRPKKPPSDRRKRWRTRLRLHPGQGFATGWQIRTNFSKRAVWKDGKQLRPTAARKEVEEYATYRGRAHHGRRIYSGMEEHVGLVAPTRGGKTVVMADNLLDWPGPVLSTSTKGDMYRLTAPLRSQHGRVIVWDPQGRSGVRSSMFWSPLEGCESPTVADRRASDLAGGVKMDDVKGGAFFERSAAGVLKLLMHAAAIGGRDMRDVAAWARQADAPEPVHILRTYPGATPGWAEDLEKWQRGPDDTIGSVLLTLDHALGFMADPNIAAACCPGPNDPRLDVADFVESYDTLYLIGKNVETASIAPLFRAFVSHLYEAATATAAANPARRRLSRAERFARWYRRRRNGGIDIGEVTTLPDAPNVVLDNGGRSGRLDPPLLLALDEAANICPVPLPDWSTDSAGQGIVLMVALQARAQLTARWGEEGGRVIWSNLNTRVIFPGLIDERDLDALSKRIGPVRVLSGSNSRDLETGHRSRSEHYVDVPVMSPSAIAELPDKWTLVISRNRRPVLVRPRRVFERKDYKQAIKEGLAVKETPRLLSELDATEIDATPVLSVDELAQRRYARQQAPSVPAADAEPVEPLPLQRVAGDDQDDLLDQGERAPWERR